MTLLTGVPEIGAVGGGACGAGVGWAGAGVGGAVGDAVVGWIVGLSVQVTQVPSGPQRSQQSLCPAHSAPRGAQSRRIKTLSMFGPPFADAVTRTATGPCGQVV